MKLLLISLFILFSIFWGLVKNCCQAGNEEGGGGEAEARPNSFFSTLSSSSCVYFLQPQYIALSLSLSDSLSLSLYIHTHNCTRSLPLKATHTHSHARTHGAKQQFTFLMGPRAAPNNYNEIRDRKAKGLKLSFSSG